MQQTREAWRAVFYITASVYAFGTIFYGVFGSRQLQPWAIPPNSPALHDVDVEVADSPSEEKRNQWRDSEKTLGLCLAPHTAFCGSYRQCLATLVFTVPRYVARYVRCLSVSPSQAGVLSKRLDIISSKQRRICQPRDCGFLMPKILVKFPSTHQTGGLHIHEQYEKNCDFLQITRYISKTVPYGPINSASHGPSCSYRSDAHPWVHSGQIQPVQDISCFLFARWRHYNFWATVVLSDRCSVCPVLSVTLVYCGQTVCWIKMKLSTWHKSRPRPRSHCVRWEPSSLFCSVP